MKLLQKAATSAAEWLGRTLRLTDAAFWRYYFGGDNYAGRPVSAQTALQVATVWACVRLLSQTIGTMPLFLYEKDAQGRRRVATAHPLYTVLHDQPNANMTAADFWEVVVACICLWGNAYCLKQVAGGRIVSLDPLRPEFMCVKVSAGGALVYVYTDERGKRTEFSEDEIFHVKGFTVDGLMGLSPIAYARNSLGIAMAAEETAGKIFSNGLRPSGVVSTDQILNPKNREEIRESVIAQVGGASNAGKTLVLEAGMKYQQVTMNPEDAQMLESRAFAIEELCRWFYNIPPMLVGHASQGQTMWGSGVEQIMLGWLALGLQPLLVKIEQSIKKGLLAPAERRRYFAKFSVEGLLRADSAGRAAFYASAVQNGWKTRNEVRELEDDEPKEGGDVLTVQSNLVPIGQLGAASADGAVRDALKSWLGLPDFGGKDET